MFRKYDLIFQLSISDINSSLAIGRKYQSYNQD